MPEPALNVLSVPAVSVSGGEPPDEFEPVCGVPRSGVVVSAPIAYFVMQKWLNEFAYHIQLGGPILILTFLTMLVLSWITIGYKALRFANSNPVDSLRDE